MRAEDKKDNLTLNNAGNQKHRSSTTKKTVQNHKELIAQSRMRTAVTNRINSLLAVSQIPEVSGNKENR